MAGYFIFFPERRPPRYLADRANPLDLSDNEFIKRYRVDPQTFLDLCDQLAPDLVRETNGYSAELQVLSSLRLLGSGSFQSVIADECFTMVSQATISRNLTRVINALVKISKDVIKFPSSVDELQRVKQAFFSNGGFPNTIGIIDCTHVEINRPSVPDWFVYINRKGKFTLNVQLVCDADYKILNAVARWPGSSHDSFIWNQCRLRDHLESTNHGGYLLGDSGYPLEPWLLTPFSRPANNPQSLFNDSLRSCRTVIEQCNGILKSRFRALHKTGGALCYAPEKVGEMVIACCVLHNICNSRNVPLPEEEDLVEEDLDWQMPFDNNQNTNVPLRLQGARIRDELTARYFT